MIIYQKKEIVELVNDNYLIILDDINVNDFTDTNNIDGVKEVYHDSDVSVESHNADLMLRKKCR